MQSASDLFDLQRFVDAQERVYPTVLDELRAGRKRSHWIWFVFPQIAGLGSSARRARYAVSSLDEARAYLRHDVLGPRLRECVRLVNVVEDRAIGEIFRSPDDLKVRSSMTLFAHATEDNRDFVELLARYYDGNEDPLTLQRLSQACRRIRQPCGSTEIASTTSCGGAPLPAITSAGPESSRTRSGASSMLSATINACSP